MKITEIADKIKLDTQVKRVKNKLMKKYGITLYYYKEKHIKQNGKCAICGVSYLDYKKMFTPVINSTTNDFESLVCSKCVGDL